MPRSTDILAVLAVLTCTLAAGAAQTCDCLVCDDGSEVQDQKKNIAKPGEPAFNCVGTLMANMDKFKCNVKKSMAEKTQKESIGHCKSMQESAQGDEDARDADLSASGGASDTAEQICSGVQEKDGTCQTCRAVQAEFYEKIGDKMNVDGCVELQNNLDFRKMSYPLADSAICEKHKKAFSFANVKDMQENFDRFELIYWPPKSTSSLADAKADTTFHYNCAMIGCCASFPVSCGTGEEGIASKNECEKGETPERYHRPFKGRLCRKKGVNERGSESDLICVPHTDGPCPETHEDCADFATDARTCDASCSTGTPVVFNSPKLDLIGKGKSLREVTGLPEEQKAVVCCQEHGKSVSIVREDECTTNEEMIQARNDQDGAGRDRRMELLARGTVVEFACCLEPRTEPNEPCTDETVNKDRAHKWARDPKRRLEDELFRIEVRKQRWRDLAEHERELKFGEEQFRPAGERADMGNVEGRNVLNQLASGLRGSHEISTTTREITGDLGDENNRFSKKQTLLRANSNSGAAGDPDNMDVLSQLDHVNTVLEKEMDLLVKADEEASN